MKKRTMLLGGVYAVLEALVGLMVHPYKTMRELLRGKSLSWVMFWPSALWIGITAMVVWVPNALLLWIVPYPMIWIFLFLWSGFFTLIYQSFLIYLAIRFRRLVLQQEDTR